MHQYHKLIHVLAASVCICISTCIIHVLTLSRIVWCQRDLQGGLPHLHVHGPAQGADRWGGDGATDRAWLPRGRHGTTEPNVPWRQAAGVLARRRWHDGARDDCARRAEAGGVQPAQTEPKTEPIAVHRRRASPGGRNRGEQQRGGFG